MHASPTLQALYAITLTIHARAQECLSSDDLGLRYASGTGKKAVKALKTAAFDHQHHHASPVSLLQMGSRSIETSMSSGRRNDDQEPCQERLGTKGPHQAEPLVGAWLSLAPAALCPGRAPPARHGFTVGEEI